MQLVYLRPLASLACAFAGVPPNQRPWSNSKGNGHHPVGHINNLLCVGGALPQLSPHTFLFHRALPLSFIRCLRKTSILFFFILYWCTHTSWAWRLLALSWIKLLFEDISCTHCALSYRPPKLSITERWITVITPGMLSVMCVSVQCKEHLQYSRPEDHCTNNTPQRWHQRVHK